MNIFKLTLIPAAFAAAVLIPAGAFAQQTADPAPAASAAPGQWGGHRHHAGFMRAMRGLNLTDQQKTQIKQLVQQFRQAHPRGSQPDPEARKQLRQQILGVLTPAQQAQLKTNMQHMRDQYRNSPPQPQGSPQP